jgi:hypothetical protein
MRAPHASARRTSRRSSTDTRCCAPRRPRSLSFGGADANNHRPPAPSPTRTPTPFYLLAAAAFAEKIESGTQNVSSWLLVT